MSFHLQVPPSARDQLAKYFQEFCGEKAHLSNLVAADLLLRSGLPRHEMKQLWDLGSAVGCDYNLAWFVMVMFDVTAWRNLRAEVNEDVKWNIGGTVGYLCDICGEDGQVGQIFYMSDIEDDWGCCLRCSKTSKASRHKLRPWRLRQVYLRVSGDGQINCDRCPNVLQVGDCVYYCKICNNGNFDLCSACYANVAKRCGHDLQLNLVADDKNTRWSNIWCDRCNRHCPTGSYVYWCKVCNEGSFDLCDACCTLPTNRCGHTISRVQIHTLKDKGPEKQKNYGSPSDIASPNDVGQVGELSKGFGDMMLRDSLKGSILTEKPQVKWHDVAGLEPAKNELREAIVLPIKHPQLFDGKRRAKRAILLYGPPGTGKSYLAKAVATEVDHTLFSISSSDLMSKWYGESEGLVRQLFQLARSRKPSIIFIDEIDALCGDRDGPGGGNEDTARMKTEFLVQVDGVGKDNDGVLLLAATNRPWELDPAVRRRFQKRIHIPLPDYDARKQLFQIHGGDAARSFTDQQLQALAQRTQGLSGSDIANASQEAMLLPIRRAVKATFFREVRMKDDIFFMPSTSRDPWAKRMNWEDVPDGKLKDPEVELQDFLEAVQSNKSSVAPEEIRKCHAWTEQYGFEGA